MQPVDRLSQCFPEIQAVDAKQALDCIRTIPAESIQRDLARKNIEEVSIFLEQIGRLEQSRHFLITRYQSQESIVSFGNLTASKFPNNELPIYAPVPLGIILSGEIIVIKEGKTTKRLLPGDFIGLFETANYLYLNSTRRIGNWSLLADAETELLYFSDLTQFRPENRQFYLQFENYLIDTARNDLVPQPITDLPLLDWVAAKVTKNLLEDTFVIAHTHVLPTSLALFRHLAHLVGYANMLVLEKPYSTVRSAADRLVKMGVELVPVIMVDGAPYDFAVKRSVEVLWDKVINIQKKRNIKRLLILDDGGDIYLSIPWNRLEQIEICGVEQTQRGINRLKNEARQLPPVVNVAGSQVKKKVESVFIGRSIVDKLKSLGLLDNLPAVGIIGAGSIGRAVTNDLTKLGIKVVTYDIDRHIQEIKGVQTVTSIDAVINKVDIVIGCTGEDFLKGIALERIEGKKTLVSASSADIEFFSLLNMAYFPNRNFDTICINPHAKLELNLLNSGYPINFDREKAWVEAQNIQITRCLLYVGMMQSLQSKVDCTQQILELDSTIQNDIIGQWRKLKREDDAVAEHIADTTHTDVSALPEMDFSPI
jgi:S-adenosylhomocysteine hydrolase